MINKKTYTFRVLRYLFFGIVASLLSAFVMQYLFTQFNFQETYSFVFHSHTKLFLFGAGILFTIYMWLTALTGSSILGSSLLMIVSILISVTSYVKFQYRNEPLYPNELGMITNFSELITMINTSDIIIGLGIVIFTSLVTFILYRKFSIKKELITPRPLHYGWRIITILVSSLFIIYVSQFNNPENRVKEYFSTYTKWVTYNQNKNYNQNGFIAGFLYNMGTIYMEEPEDYSKEKIEDLYRKYSEIAESINKDRTQDELDTNLIFIMNESFSDPLNLEGFTTDKDPIPFTRELMNNTLSGESLALNIGGGTANSEFEALTSLSNEPLKIYAPYVEAVDIMDSVPSIVKRANKDNLKTTAIHPYDPTLYKRLSVYDSLGFQEFIHQDTMNYTDKMGNSWHISDSSAYREMIDVLEDSQEKDFIHIVTMQNHIRYHNKYENPSFDTSGAELKQEGDGYMEDLHNSDKALEDLIGYVDNAEEDYLLVFWGDHLPGIYNEEVFDQNSQLEMRKTPLFFYSNRAQLSGDIGTISPIYYINHVLEILDIKVSPYEALINNLEVVLPGLSGAVYLESNMNETHTSRNDLSNEAINLLDELNMIQYDIVSGKQYTDEFGFFEYYNE